MFSQQAEFASQQGDISTDLKNPDLTGFRPE